MSDSRRLRVVIFRLFFAVEFKLNESYQERNFNYIASIRETIYFIEVKFCTAT